MFILKILSMVYGFLLHRYKWFNEKQTIRIFHTKLYPGYEWDIFYTLTSEDNADVIPLFFLCFSSSFFYFRNTHIYVIKRKFYTLV